MPHQLSETIAGLWPRHTPGYAPLGYLNGRTRVDGREVKTIELDAERASHIAWAFESYAGGEWSISDLVEELKRRGMRTRPTATRAAVPLSASQVHRTLSSSYYIGMVPYRGIEYQGKHEPLIDKVTWHQVQDVLAARRIAGNRAWKHDHYLKGSLFCDRCGDRLAVSYSQGKGGTVYPYFYCLGRNKKRTDCDLPFVPIEVVEGHVLRYWSTVRLDHRLIVATKRSVQAELAEQRKTDAALLVSQRRLLNRLAAQKQKLIDAYLAEALPVSDLKQRQQGLAVEQRDAERLLELASANHELAEQRLEQALELLEHCERMYISASEEVRRHFNQAFFAELHVDQNGVRGAVLNSPFAELIDRSIGLQAGVEDDNDETTPVGPVVDNVLYQRQSPAAAPGLAKASRSGRARSTHRGVTTSNATTLRSWGSNLTLLAEGVGFEPTMGVTP